MEACVICKKSTKYSHTYDATKTLFESKKIFKCQSCEYHFCADIEPIALNSYYETSYDENDFGRSKTFPSPEDYFNNRSNQFKPDRSDAHINSSLYHLDTQSKISILDCGAGLGTTLNIAKNTFPNSELHAFENDIFSKMYLDYIGVTQHSGDLLSFLKENTIEFDLIICSHFLEHVAPTILLEIRDLLLKSLSDDGILLLEVPNDNWFEYPHKIHNLPPHVSFFSIKSLKLMFQDSKIVSIGTLWGTSRPRQNFFLSIFDLIYRKVSKVFYNLPYTKHGDSIFALIKK